MKYLSYLLGVFIAVLGILFYSAYLDNHTYYFSMLHSSSNWYILIFGLFSIMIPVIYILLKGKKTWGGILISILLAFALFTLVVGINKGGYISYGYINELINFAILFVFYGAILLGSLALGDLLLQKIEFKKSIYNFAIKFGFGFAILSLVLYYLVALGGINVYISYVLLFLLVGLIFLRKKTLKILGDSLLDDLEQFNNYLSKFPLFQGIIAVVLLFSFFYIFIGFNYTFIAYPTAWDANHAYMFWPKVFANYDGYPWSTDFRPGYILWSAVLAWIYKLGFWTTFSPDTWMISFNFITGILSLLFGFMLVNTIISLIRPEKDVKHIALLSLGYTLIIAWLTSGMGAFLVFVDNKTDLATLMYILLGLFLAVYSIARIKSDDEFIEAKVQKLELGKFEEEEIEEKRYSIDFLFLALSGFFFAIANLIKATATFDFFETALVFAITNIGLFVVIGVILFVVGLLAYLKFRGFDKAVSPTLSKPLMLGGLVLSLIDMVYSFVKNKFKIFAVFVFVFSFVGTLLFTKGFFGLLQYYHDKNIDTNIAKIVPSIIMGTNLPTVSHNELTGDLYKGLKKEIGSTYNEDNGRYEGYGSHNFGNVWWSFIVPDKFKNNYCMYFDKVLYSNSTCKNKIYIPEDKSNISKTFVHKISMKVLSQVDEDIINKIADQNVYSIKQSGKIKQLASSLGINPNLSPNIIESQIFKKARENYLKQIANLIKAGVKKGDFDGLVNKIPFKNTNDIKNISKKEYTYTSVSIPYKYLTPFNVTFNWSLQNLTSYYTDIGIVWLILFFINIIVFVYATFLWIYKLTKKDDTYNARLLFAFAFATLVGWTIWKFVASGIVWYNIGGIIWLIITTLIFVALWKDRLFLLYVLLSISVVGIFLNLIRISSQGGGELQTWYKSSIGQKNILENNTYKLVPKYSFGFDDLFNMQFPYYKKAIQGFNQRSQDEKGIIGGTYIKYFIKNQNKIQDDQFLTYLRKLGSDDNVDKFYKRLKDQHITDIVLDPNIASVVMGTGNIDLWYRYYGKTDKNGNLTEKGVFPHFVDLANSGYIQYISSNDLPLKYALTITDDELAKITGITDKKELRELKYNLSSVRFVGRWASKTMQLKAYNILAKIIEYRIKQAENGNYIPLLSDLADMKGIVIDDYNQFIKDGVQNISKLDFRKQQLFIEFNQILGALKNNPNSIKSIVSSIIKQAFSIRSRILYVKVK